MNQAATTDSTPISALHRAQQLAADIVDDVDPLFNAASAAFLLAESRDMDTDAGRAFILLAREVQAAALSLHGKGKALLASLATPDNTGRFPF